MFTHRALDDAVVERHGPVGDGDHLEGRIEVAGVERLVLLRLVEYGAVVRRKAVEELRTRPLALGDDFADAVGEFCVAPFETIGHRGPVRVLRDPFRMLLLFLLADVAAFEAVLGRRQHAAHAVAPHEDVVEAVAASAPIHRVGRVLEIDLLDDQLRLLRDDLAQFARHEPPAAELVEEGVDGVGVREHGLAV